MSVPVHLFGSYLRGGRLIEILGYVAAACTTFAFVPQIAKIKKQGGEDISYWMLGIYLAGLNLWLLYGFILHSAPIIAANILSIMLSVFAIVLKVATAKPRLLVDPAGEKATVHDQQMTGDEAGSV